MPPTPPYAPHELPSSRQLIRATLLAAAVAAALLVTVVLPAEFGIDPTGIGPVLGLYREPADTATPGPAPEDDVAAATGGGGAVFTSTTPYRSDELSITLAPGEGAEIKAEMRAGERLVYSWTASGNGVDVDMHGEAVGQSGADRSYQAGEFQTSGHGALEAPMTGNHGWFWQNLNDDPVTVTVKTAGFYRRLFKP